MMYKNVESNSENINNWGMFHDPQEEERKNRSRKKHQKN